MLHATFSFVDHAVDANTRAPVQDTNETTLRKFSSGSFISRLMRIALNGGGGGGGSFFAAPAMMKVP